MAKPKFNYQWERVQRTQIPADETRRQQRNFATFNSHEFIKLCEHLNIKPTTRQASKYNNNKGSVYKSR